MNLPANCSTLTQLPPHTPNSKFHPKNTTSDHLTTQRNLALSINQTVSWTSSISHYCHNGNLHKATSLFTLMRHAEIKPNDVTFITLLSACSHFPSKSSHYGIMLHGLIVKYGFQKDNVILWTSLLDMYAKSCRVNVARKVFDEMPKKNSRTWNVMIDGYMRSGEFENAVCLFDEMPQRDRDKISWTALINGFVKKSRFVEGLEFFREMQLFRVEPDHVTIIAALSACANLGVLGVGMWFHCYAMRIGIGENIRVCNSLIDMYSRCGCVDFARGVFEKMDTRSLVSWNSMIVGLAVNGYAEEALEHFVLMQEEGFKPDGVSFTGALTACSHAGLVEEGLKFYNTMTKVHKISPRIEHYGCVVDLLSRAGQLEDAFSLIKAMPMKPNEVVLGSLLTACRTHGDFNLAERLTHYLLDFMPGSDSNYVTLSNIYAAAGRWDGVGKVRRTMKAKGISKRRGISAIEIDCSIHEFMAGDKSHVYSDDIYAILDQIFVEMRLCGYVPETNVEDLSEFG